MKKLLICCLATILTGSILISCSSKDSKPEEKPNSTVSTEENKNTNVIDTVLKEFKEKDYIPMPLERNDTELKELYFSKLEDIKFDDTIENYSVIETGRSPGVGFALILKAKPGKIDDAKKIAQSVLEIKVGNAFYPDEKEIANNSKVEVNGDYASLFILNDDIKEEALKFYNNTIK